MQLKYVIKMKCPNCNKGEMKKIKDSIKQDKIDLKLTNA